MKKNFSIKGLAVIFLITIAVLIPVVIFAIVEQPSYSSMSFINGGKIEVISKIGSSTIVNRSDKDFFVPNNTAPEYTAWSKNAPNYVEVSVCGDVVIFSKKNKMIIRKVNSKVFNEEKRGVALKSS